MLEFLFSLFSENAVEFKSSEFIRFISQFDDLTTDGFYFDEDGYIFDGSEKRHWTSYIPSILISGAVLALMVYVVYKALKEAVGMGTFSRFFKYNQENKRYAFKVIGCHVVWAERGGEKEHFTFLVTYLYNKFPNIGKPDTQELYKLAFLFKDIRKPLSWLKNNMSKEDRIQVIDFMVDLAFFNGQLNKRELKLIYLAGEVLEVPRHEIRSILGIRQNHYRQKEARERAQREQQRKRTTSSRPFRSSSKKNTSLKVLGLPNTTNSFQEVRKAYRSLARKHHPDRYMRASETEQQMAHERFTQINLAYEYLEETMK